MHPPSPKTGGHVLKRRAWMEGTRVVEPGPEREPPTHDVDIWNWHSSVLERHGVQRLDEPIFQRYAVVVVQGRVVPPRGALHLHHLYASRRAASFSSSVGSRLPS